MTPIRSHGIGSLVLKGTFGGVKIERATGIYRDEARVALLRAMCHTLADAGRQDILREIAVGRLKLRDVWTRYRRGDWSHIPTTVHATPLLPAFQAWRARVPGERHRWDLRLAEKAFAVPHATVADLPALVLRLREQYRAKGAGRQFNKFRAAAMAFLRQTYTRANPLWGEVAAVEPLPVTRKLERHPQTPDGARAIAAQLGGEAGRCWWQTCCTGMNPKEFWVDGWEVEDGVLHVHGRKRKGRERTLPAVLDDLERPTISRGAYEHRLKRAKLGVTPKDARHSFAVWMGEAGISQAHQDAYLGHGPRTMGDLYRQHTVRVEMLDADRATLRAYIGLGVQAPTPRRTVRAR